MKLRIPILLLILALLTISCQIGENDDTDFTYPLESGRSWTYQREFITADFDSDSLEQIFGFSESYELTTAVVGPQTLNDSIEVTGIVSGGRTSYYREDADGLYLIAYSMTGGEIAIPKKAQTGSLLVNGVHFDHLEQLFSALQQPMAFMKSAEDSVYFETADVKVLDYPLEDADVWCFREAQPFRIDKKIMGMKEMNTDAGTFSCYRIKWNYDMDHDGMTDDNVYINDYISREGLIKRSITVRDIIIMGSFGDTLGTYNTFDDYTLKHYTK